MTDLERAIAFATEAHAGQVDKLGEPYILHPLRVMLAVSPEARRVAVLHDVVEDTRHLLSAVMKAVDLDGDEFRALWTLTRRAGETYDEYIGVLLEPHLGSAVKRLAREVKVADLQDNLGRWTPEIGEDLKRRYERALARLTEGETT